MLQSNLAQDVRHAVPDGRSGRQGQIHNAERNVHPSGSLSRHQLSHSRHLECGFLDRLTEHLEAFSTHLFQSRFHHAGAADTHVNDLIRLRHAMEGSRHKRIVIRRVAEGHQLRAGRRIGVRRQMCRFQNDLSHQAHRIHIDARLGGTQIDRAAHPFRGRERLGDGTDQKFIRRRHAL